MPLVFWSYFCKTVHKNAQLSLFLWVFISEGPHVTSNILNKFVCFSLKKKKNWLSTYKIATVSVFYNQEWTASCLKLIFSSDSVVERCDQVDLRLYDQVDLKLLVWLFSYCKWLMEKLLELFQGGDLEGIQSNDAWALVTKKEKWHEGPKFCLQGISELNIQYTSSLGTYEIL